MKKLLVLLAVSFIGCNGSLDAILRVSQEFTINFEKLGERQVVPGEYEVEISMNEKKSYFNIEFQNFEGKKDPDARFSYPLDMEFPERNGTFNVDHRDTGQNIGLAGDVKTTVDKSAPRRESESCQERVRRTECHTDNKGRTVCRDYWDWEHGWKEVEYIEVRTRKNILVSLVSETNDNLGTLKAVNTSVYRDYIWEGRCGVW